MKLSLMQENLARGLSLVSRAVSSRATLPVLANVLLKTQDGGLRLTATNLEIGMSVWVPGKIETDGTMTVPARLITDVVGGLRPHLYDLGVTLVPRDETVLEVLLDAPGRVVAVAAEEVVLVAGGGDRIVERVLAQPGRQAVAVAVHHVVAGAAVEQVVAVAAVEEVVPTQAKDGVVTRATAQYVVLGVAGDVIVIETNEVRTLPCVD